MGLKVLWKNTDHLFKGKNITNAWQEEVASLNCEMVDNITDASIVFFSSDSQIDEQLLGKKATICYFWGWPPHRMLDRTFRKFAEKKLGLIAQCTKILVPSPVTRDQLYMFGLPSEICYPGVDTKTIDIVSRKPRKEQILFLGRIADYKNLDILIQAVALLQPQPLLVVGGPGDIEPYKVFAEQLGVNMVHSEMTDEEKSIALHESRMLVHPSGYEGWGLPPQEALICDTPVIVLDTPHMRWLLQENAYYANRPESFAAQIKYVIEHSLQATDMAMRGNKMVRGAYTLQIAAQSLWGFFHRTIKDHLAGMIRLDISKAAEIYDEEHKRNWAYSVDRFDPTWERHWRAQSLIKSLKAYKATTVLDIGCGPVYPTILARAGMKVTGFDISQECIRQVLEVAGKWDQADNVTGVVGNAEHLEFKDNSFDAVIQGEIWEHVKDIKAIVAEALRVLKPGGCLLASTPIGTHHYDAMHLTVWDDRLMDEFLADIEKTLPVEKTMVEKIAEDGTDPSCYFIVVEKKE